MARPPFTPAPSPNQPPPPGQPGAPGRPTPLGGMPQPGSHPGPQSGQPPQAPSKPAERRTLVVGRGISLQGVIQDAERLVVEGTVEAQLLHAAELVVAPGGIFKGEVEVDDAEIAGTIDGSVAARGNLIVRGTGKVIGTARYRRLQVEDGGQISGRMEMITEGPAAANG